MKTIMNQEKLLPKHITNPDPSIYLTSNNYAVLDFETTNIDYGDPTNQENELLLAGVYFSKTGSYHAWWGNEYEQSEMCSRLEEVDFIVAHNAKFELGWLLRCGMDLTKLLVYCTQIGEYVLYANLHIAKDLDSVASRYKAPKKNPRVKKLLDLGINPKVMPKRMLEEYCLGDVIAEHIIFLAQREKLAKLGLHPHQYTRCLFTPALADLENNGMHLDPARVNELFLLTEKRYVQLTKELSEFTGGINQNSPKQVAEFIYDRLGFSELTDSRGNPIRTEGGGRSTDKKDIVRLKARSKRQREFIELYLRQSKAETQHKNYLEKFKECVDKANGILLASFNQTVTKTHRLSSSGKRFKVQFQNMDREFKPLFSPRHEGWLMGEADEAQLEFRAAVWLGNDKQGRRDIKNKEDVHSFTASVLHDIPYNVMIERKKAGDFEALTWRQDAKEDTFKSLYGGQSGTPAQVRYYKAFREKYKDITDTQKGWAEYVLKHKKLIMPHGFIFYYPDTKLTKTGYITNTTNIYNYPVQHLATAEIVPIGVVYEWHRMKAANMQSFLVNTVHDSIIGEIHPDEVELFKEISVQALTKDVIEYMKKAYNINFDVPLEAEISLNSHWGEKTGWMDKYRDVVVNQ